MPGWPVLRSQPAIPSSPTRPTSSPPPTAPRFLLLECLRARRHEVRAMKHTPRPLSLYFVAGEESGDALGGALARALLAQEQGMVRLAGIGGQAMAAAGIASPFPIDDLSII